MPTARLAIVLAAELEALGRAGTRKGTESVITEVIPPRGDRGPRYRLAGEGRRDFLRMNSNSYLGMSFEPAVIAAEEAAVRRYGAGPGAVRFISGTWEPHVALERRLAAFHDREAAMIFSSAYATVLGVVPPLVTPETAVLSDELNHNCIINATRLARPKQRHLYPHLDLATLEDQLDAAAAECGRALVVTDGVFSMRGDYAPLAAIARLCAARDAAFADGALSVVDDSHGVGALGPTGRGTEEVTGARADLLVGTLGKALGVNGGYVAGPAPIIAYLREKAAMYVYSNPITPGEAAAALTAVEQLDSEHGRARLRHLHAMTERFERGLQDLGLETIVGPHPVVPLMVRDAGRTAALVRHLRAHGVLATGLGYPVVPRGDEEIRFQVSADHTEADIDEVLTILGSAPGR